MNFEQDTVSGSEGFHWLEEIKSIDAALPVVFMTAYADMDKAIRAIKAGAMDFTPKPFHKCSYLFIQQSPVAMASG